MFASTPTTSLSSARAHRRDASESPTCRLVAQTPPRLGSNGRYYESPMLTPSRLRKSTVLGADDTTDFDDLFLGSPCQSPTLTYKSRPEAAAEENGGTVFLSLSPSLSSSTPFATSSSHPLLTPIKLAHKTSIRPQSASRLPSDTVSANGAGTKRKSTSNTTPLRQHALTPLDTSSRDANFHRLAPRPSQLRTPDTKEQTERFLKNPSDSMTKLRISDPDEFEEFMEPNSPSFGRGPADSSFESASGDLPETVSPGGHVVKRRARSRPVSQDLKQSVDSSAPKRPTFISHSRKKKTNLTRRRLAHRRESSASSSDCGSPMSPDRRDPDKLLMGPPGPPEFQPPPVLAPRAPMQRLESSASLFFGPKIELGGRARTTSTATSDEATKSLDFANNTGQRPKMANRHSYSGDSSFTWTAVQPRSLRFSPETSPSSVPSDRSMADDDEYMLQPNLESSFILNVTRDTPPPNIKRLRTKYKPRDSGIALSDDEDTCGFTFGRSSSMNGMPPASSSVSSMSDCDDELVTPGVGPNLDSGWPTIVLSSNRSLTSEVDKDVDVFIMETLKKGSKQSNAEHGLKKAPGTPVKKNKTFFPVNRPWQSAAVDKVGRGPQFEPKKGKAPRKSGPAAFPPTFKNELSPTDSDGEEDSPSFRKHKYATLGLGRPTAGPTGRPSFPRPSWLMRRSSSGNFSSGSTSDSTTPTKSRDLSALRDKVQASPSARSSSSSSMGSVNSPLGQRVTISRSRKAPPSKSDINESGQQKDHRLGQLRKDLQAVDEIGSGEFGMVIKVKDSKEQFFAVKKSKRFEGPKHRQRLLEEVDVLRHLSSVARHDGESRHPNVLLFLDGWEEDEKLFIQTELCAYGSLSSFLWEYGRVFARLDEVRVWKILADLSNGLEFIHCAGVIHLDLKPANVFITSEGRFVIGDFGLASLWPRATAEAAKEGSFEREGDKLYLAPEILQGQYGKAADVFSLGVTMLETACNIVVPGQGESWHLLRDEDFSEIEFDGSPELFELIRSMMRKDPSKRLCASSVKEHPIVCRARTVMERLACAAREGGRDVFEGSPLGAGYTGMLEDILGRDAMDVED